MLIFFLFVKNVERLMPWLHQLGDCANRDFCYLIYGTFVYVRILVTMSTFHFYIFHSTIYILVLPRATYPTTRFPRNYQILLAEFWYVCLSFMGKVVIVDITAAGNIILLITGIITAELNGNIEISGRVIFFIYFGFFAIDQINFRDCL